MKQHLSRTKYLYRIIQASVAISALSAAGSAQALEGFTLDILPPLTSYALPNDINQAGQVAGRSHDRERTGRAVSWEIDNNISLLPTNLSSEEDDFANAINEVGYVVGSGYVNRHCGSMASSHHYRAVAVMPMISTIPV